MLMAVVGLAACQSSTQQDEAPAREASAPAAKVFDGADIYAARCVECHQPDGSGVPGAIPPLDGADWVNGSADRLVRILQSGLEGDIEVNGERYTGAMPRFLGGPEATAAVLTYIRGAWSNQAPAVTPEHVRAIRAATPFRNTPWTFDELLRLEQADGAAPPVTEAAVETR